MHDVIAASAVTGANGKVPHRVVIRRHEREFVVSLQLFHTETRTFSWGNGVYCLFDPADGPVVSAAYHKALRAFAEKATFAADYILADAKLTQEVLNYAPGIGTEDARQLMADDVGSYL